MYKHTDTICMHIGHSLGHMHRWIHTCTHAQHTYMIDTSMYKIYAWITCMHIHAHAWAYTYVQTNTWTYTHTHSHIHGNTHTQTYVDGGTDTHGHKHMQDGWTHMYEGGKTYQAGVVYGRRSRSCILHCSHFGCTYHLFMLSCVLLQGLKSAIKEIW